MAQPDAHKLHHVDMTPAGAGPVRPRHNLPTALTPFVGREGERTQLNAWLRDPACRLITIAGAGGVGKTRLAIEVARAIALDDGDAPPFASGIYFVSLAAGAAESPDDGLATTIASALGMTLSGPDSPVAQVRHYLREKAMLLILDNLEHLPTGGLFIANLLQDAPALKIVATSRERLNVRGEWVVALDGLAFPPRDGTDVSESPERYSAVQLFLQSSRPLVSDFALTAETAPAVVKICQLVDGLPLGIELAAGWTRLLACDEIAREIAQNLDFLTSSAHDLPKRQRSLRAVFDSSWNLLTPAEQQALRQLAIFQGSFTREAAAACGELRIENEELRKGGSDPAILNSQSGAPWAILNLLASLIDKSLVRRITTAGSTARYEVPDPLRQYATEQLERAGEAAALAGRHAAYYLNMLASRVADLRGPGQLAALAAIGAEIDQMRAAWQHAVAQADDRALGPAADGLFHFYDMRSWFREGAAAFGAASQALATQAGDGAALVYGKVLARQGWFTFHLGRQREAKTLLEQSLAVLRARDARAELVFVLNYLGVVCSYLGEYPATDTLCRESLAITAALGDHYGRAVACNILGQAAYDRGEFAVAREWSQQSLAIEQQIGNRWSMAYSLTNLGKVAYKMGAYAEARQMFEQSLRTREEIGDARGVAICFNRLGDTAVALGDTVEAGARYAQSLARFREIGNQRGITASLINLGQLALSHGRAAAAARLYQEALRLALGTQALPQVGTIVSALAMIARLRGELALADELKQLLETPGALASHQAHTDRLLVWADSAARAPDQIMPMTLDQAIATATAPLIEQAAGTAPARATGASAPAYPAGLTAREVEVLRLVAQGLTDIQVAERLILSPRTVSTHLSTIYGKLQVTSRSAATRFAVEQGLV
jgi:predicted ATPase/DNA-binding CsgD family transcriptional regulator